MSAPAGSLQSGACQTRVRFVPRGRHLGSKLLASFSKCDFAGLIRPVNSTVATTQNQLGILAFQSKHLDAAQSYFTQARDNWKQLFGDQYPSVAVAYSNLGSVCLEKNNLPCAERMYRDAVSRLDAYSANSLNDAVAHLKLGRALLREGRYAQAEPESLFGYNYLVANVAPNDRFLVMARKDLASIYDGLYDTEKATRYRAELAAAAQSARK